MYRRCEFLEDSPYLKYNMGVGEPKKNERGEPTEEYTDTRQLRSVLLQTMMDEVSDFCKQSVREQDKSVPYHQVWCTSLDVIVVLKMNSN